MKTLILIFITLLCFTKGYAQWYKVNSNTTENINDIFFVNENVGYCIAGDGILKSTDGGDSWNKVYNNNIRSFGYIVAHKDTVIAFARSDDDGFKHKYTSVDNGNNWNNEKVNYQPMDVQYSNNNIFYTLFGESESYLKKLSNGVITTISDNAYVYGVNKNEIVYVNDPVNTIYKSADSGLTWETLPSFPPNISQNQLSEAKIKSFNDTIIFSTTYPNDISFSYDNGKSWTQGIGGSFVSAIVNSSTVYGAGSSIYIYIYVI